MAGTLDKWVLLLFLDSSQFKKGADSVSRTADGLRNILAKTFMTTDLSSGLNTIVDKFVGTALSIDKVSRATGVGAKSLQAWELAFKDAGASGESALQSISSLSGKLGDMKIGKVDSSFIEGLQRLGVYAHDSQGDVKDATTLLSELAKATEGRDPQELKALMSQVGISDDALYALQKTGKSIDGIIAKKKLLANHDNKSIGLAEKYKKNVAQLENLWNSVATTIAMKVVPHLNKGLDLLGKILQNTTAVEVAFVGVAAVVGGVAIKGFILSLKALAALLSPLVLGIAAVAVGAYLLYRNWDKVTESVKEYLAESPRLSEFLEGVKILFNGIVDVISYAIEKASEFLKFIWELFDGFSLIRGIVSSIWDFGGDVVNLVYTAADAVGKVAGGAVAGLQTGDLSGGVKAALNTSPASTYKNQAPVNNSTTNTNTRFENVAIYTQATDGKGIMRDLQRQTGVIITPAPKSTF